MLIACVSRSSCPSPPPPTCWGSVLLGPSCRAQCGRDLIVSYGLDLEGGRSLVASGPIGRVLLKPPTMTCDSYSLPLVLALLNQASKDWFFPRIVAHDLVTSAFPWRKPHRVTSIKSSAAEGWSWERGSVEHRRYRSTAGDKGNQGVRPLWLPWVTGPHFQKWGCACSYEGCPHSDTDFG